MTVPTLLKASLISACSNMQPVCQLDPAVNTGQEQEQKQEQDDEVLHSITGSANAPECVALVLF